MTSVIIWQYNYTLSPAAVHCTGAAMDLAQSVESMWFVIQRENIQLRRSLYSQMPWSIGKHIFELVRLS